MEVKVVECEVCGRTGIDVSPFCSYKCEVEFLENN